MSVNTAQVIFQSTGVNILLAFASVALSVRCFDNYYKFLPTLWLNMSTQTVFRTFSVREQNDKREEIEQLLVSLVCRRG